MRLLQDLESVISICLQIVMDNFENHEANTLVLTEIETTTNPSLTNEINTVLGRHRQLNVSDNHFQFLDITGLIENIKSISETKHNLM